MGSTPIAGTNHIFNHYFNEDIGGSDMKTGLYNIVLILVFIPLIYFMLIRPQRKRDKEVTSMRAALKPGDNIVTIGGIVGKIVRIKDDRILIETGSSKTKMEIIKSAVGSVVGKQEAEKKDEKDSDVKAEVAEETRTNRSKKVTPKKLGANKAENKEETEKDAE